MKIAILGAGAYGTALGEVLTGKGFGVEYYDPKISDSQLDAVISQADFILLCTPSAAIHELLPQLPTNIPLIVASKGILSERQFEGFGDYMVLAGAGFADDIKAGKPTVLTATDVRLEGLFETDRLAIELTDDRTGVLMCGALKNIYAMMAGYHNLEKGTPTWEAFVRQATEEMRAIISQNGGRQSTVDLSCGEPDLRLSCGEPSRNYEFGKISSRNREAAPDKTVEGVDAIRRVRQGEIVVPESAVILKEAIDIWG